MSRSLPAYIKLDPSVVGQQKQQQQSFLPSAPPSGVQSSMTMNSSSLIADSSDSNINNNNNLPPSAQLASQWLESRRSKKSNNNNNNNNNNTKNSIQKTTKMNPKMQQQQQQLSATSPSSQSKLLQGIAREAVLVNENLDAVEKQQEEQKIEIEETIIKKKQSRTKLGSASTTRTTTTLNSSRTTTTRTNSSSTKNSFSSSTTRPSSNRRSSITSNNNNNNYHNNNDRFAKSATSFGSLFSSTTNSPLSPSSSLTPLNFSSYSNNICIPLFSHTQILSKIQSELSDIKKRIPILTVSDSTLQQITTTTTTTTTKTENENSEISSTQVNNNNNSTISLSHQLAQERDQHRQRLDEVWRSAQGWKTRSKALEDCLRRVSSDILLTEQQRFFQLEESFRNQNISEELEMRNKFIVEPFLSLMQQFVSKWSLHRCSSKNNSNNKSILKGLMSMEKDQNERSNENNNSNSNNTSINNSNEATSGNQKTIVYKVRDSELLRSLKAAEARLAELGERMPFSGRF